jgi:ribosomal protein S27AE
MRKHTVTYTCDRCAASVVVEVPEQYPPPNIPPQHLSEGWTDGKVSHIERLLCGSCSEALTDFLQFDSQ